MKGLARFAFFTWLPLEQKADDFSLALREQTGASAPGFKSTHDQVSFTCFKSRKIPMAGSLTDVRYT